MAVSQKKCILKGWVTIICKKHGFVQRNITLSVYPQLFVISVGAENGTNFKKLEIVGLKSIFEVLYFLSRALKYIHPTYI